MKLILHISVVDKSQERHRQLFWKVLETNIVPPPGVYFADPQWGENPKIPGQVILNIEDDSCMLIFNDDVYPSAKEFDYAIAAYRANDWGSPNEVTRLGS